MNQPSHTRRATLVDGGIATKRWAVFVLCLLIALSVGYTAGAGGVDVIRILVDGREIATDVPPLNVNGRVLVPIRFVAEALGAYADWDGPSKTVIITRNGGGSITGQTPLPTGPIPVFPGYFRNPDYANPQVFLTGGPQTTTTPLITQTADRFNDRKDVTTIQEIWQWCSDNLGPGEADKFCRTADNILTSRIATGCTDYGLAFAVLARAKGIPTVFVQTARIDWVEDQVTNSSEKGMIRGHILVEVFIGGQWYLVDSTAGKLFLSYDKTNFSLPDGYYVFAKSLEVYDSGVKSESENASVMQRLFGSFDLKQYVNPKYDYIDLNTGAKQASGDSLPPQTQTRDVVIVGPREPVELFWKRFVQSPATTCSFDNLSADQLNAASSVVLLYSPDQDQQVPDCLLSVAPELRSGSGQMQLSTMRGGQRLVVIKAANSAALVDAVESLPADILTVDTR